MPHLSATGPSFASQSLPGLIQSTKDHDLLVQALGTLSQDPPAPRIVLSPKPNPPSNLLRKLCCCAQTPTVEPAVLEAQHPLLNMVRPRQELQEGAATTTLETIGDAVCEVLNQQEAFIQEYASQQASIEQELAPLLHQTHLFEPALPVEPAQVSLPRPADMDEMNATLWASRQSQMDDFCFTSLPPKKMLNGPYECPVSFGSWPQGQDAEDTVIQYPVSFEGEDAVYEFTSVVEAYIRSGQHPTGREDLEMSDLRRAVQ